MTGVLFDINVVLDVVLAREPWVADSSAVVQAALDGTLTAHLSAASLPTIFYLVRRNADINKALDVVKECLKTFTIVPVDRRALELAASLPGSDFEDNLQIACATLTSLDAIVTRDPTGFAGSPVAVLSPAELLDRLPKDDHA